jgi:protoporphyrinogen oxidase
MKIAIIGAGLTGLAAAIKLNAQGHRVVIFEKEASAGGLARGFKSGSWLWPLEEHYHHIFTSDRSILKFANDLKVPVDFKKPITSTYIDGSFYQIDNPVSLLKFSKLNLINRLRVGAVMLYIKLSPFWKLLEGIPAHRFLKKTMGEDAWKVIWEPLFAKKFGHDYKKVPASWFWARIKKRSANLGYPRGGFQKLVDKAVQSISESGGRFYFHTEISSIRKVGYLFEVIADGKKFPFDLIICTLPSSAFLKIAKGLPSGYRKKLTKLRGIGAANLILEFNRPFLTDGTYWLNVNENDYPFLCLVEQTNYINKSRYAGHSILYVGAYLPQGRKSFKNSKGALVKRFLPYLQKINPEFKKSWIKGSFLFEALFAQPLVGLNHSRLLPSVATPVPGLYLANIEQVYPWDRGTNYSVELGNKVAELIA